jgi:hypothetical protein
VKLDEITEDLEEGWIEKIVLPTSGELDRITLEP